MRSRQFELLLGSAALLFTVGPFVLGRGVDVPDDALHHSVASWEWLRYAWTQGIDPWFVPGKLGGISLASDVVPMGPLYPASWLLFLLPVHVALPLVAAAHALGILLAVRWLALSFGVGSTASTLAGAAIAAGPLGAITFIDCHLDVLPIYLWFPVMLGASERLCRAEDPAERRRWAALCAGALALLLLGSHLRFSAAACAAWGLWVLIRGMPPLWIVCVSVLGLAAGAPGFVPNLLALGEASVGVDRLAALSGPVHETYNGWNLAGWLAPKPYWMNRDFSLGAVLGLAFVLGLPLLIGSVRRLGILAALLLLAALSPSVPGLRYVFAPLLLITHPLDLVYGALALIPAAVAAARGLELLCEKRSTVPVGRVALGLLLAAMALRTALPSASFGDAAEWHAWLLGLLQASLVLGAGLLLLRRGQATPSSALQAVFLLALLDLCLLGFRYQVAVPSVDLELRERASSPDLEELGESYLDVTDLSELQGFLYDAEEMFEVSSESQADAAGWVRKELSGRRWPLHVGPGHGVPALSGRAKMPERRTIGVLMPLADALVRSEGDRRVRLEDVDPEALERLFAPGALGGRILRLTGTQTAVDRTRVVGRVEDPLPPCWNPRRYVVVDGEGEEAALAAWELGALQGNDPVERAVLEAPLALPEDLPRATVQCDDRAVRVDAEGPTLVVLLRPWLRGWSLVGEGGTSPELFPVDAFHLGFVAPAGEQSYELRFAPPGLCGAQLASLPAWLLLLGSLLVGRLRGWSR